jgi:hypothetical protein
VLTLSAFSPEVRGSGGGGAGGGAEGAAAAAAAADGASGSAAAAAAAGGGAESGDAAPEKWRLQAYLLKFSNAVEPKLLLEALAQQRAAAAAGAAEKNE